MQGGKGYVECAAREDGKTQVGLSLRGYGLWATRLLSCWGRLRWGGGPTSLPLLIPLSSSSLTAVREHVHRLQLHLRPRLPAAHRPDDGRRGAGLLDAAMCLLLLVLFSVVPGTASHSGQPNCRAASLPSLTHETDVPGHQRVPVDQPAGPKVHLRPLRLQERQGRLRVSALCSLLLLPLLPPLLLPLPAR